MKLSEAQRGIFEHLFEVGKTSKDPEGVVAACLVNQGNTILVSSASADDSIRHAEDLVIEEAKKQQITITPEMSLYTTLEPCGKRTDTQGIVGCTTLIINSGIKRVMIGALDPEWASDTKVRFEEAGIVYELVDDEDVERQCIELFNANLKTDLAKMKLPRERAL